MFLYDQQIAKKISSQDKIDEKRFKFLKNVNVNGNTNANTNAINFNELFNKLR